jgi:hypothetical protein
MPLKSVQLMQKGYYYFLLFFTTSKETIPHEKTRAGSTKKELVRASFVFISYSAIVAISRVYCK